MSKPPLTKDHQIKKQGLHTEDRKSEGIFQNFGTNLTENGIWSQSNSHKSTKSAPNESIKQNKNNLLYILVKKDANCHRVGVFMFHGTFED